jgi:hypothetical protein
VMNDPSKCKHDFRRVYPRHITQQAQTDPRERVLYVLCCNCGKSPIYFSRLGQELPKSTIPKSDWPDDLEITMVYNDREEGPSVEFRRR